MSASDKTRGVRIERHVLDTALDFLDYINESFPDRYNQFLDVKKAFKEQQVDTPDLMRQVATLFEGEDELIRSFNSFLSPGYAILPGGLLKTPSGFSDVSRQDSMTVSADSSAPGLMTFDRANQFLNEVREAFADQPGVPSQFMSTLTQHRDGKINQAALMNTVRKLFRGHDNLIDGFTFWLPRSPNTSAQSTTDIEMGG